jgi:hypothetical protein
VNNRPDSLRLIKKVIMPVYLSETQLYSCFQTLFGLIEANEPKAPESLLKASLAIRFKCRQPEANITIDAREAPVNIAYGNNAIKPTIDVGLTTDTLHCLLLGDLRLGKAVGSKQLDLKGPVWKTMALADLFHAAQQFYPQVLNDNGLTTGCPDLTST